MLICFTELLLQNQIFPKVMWKHYVGEVGKTVKKFVLQIISVYCIPDFIEIGHSL